MPDSLNTTNRKPRLLWANVSCLMDSSSGAAMAVLEMLSELARSGFEIAIFGATVFDHERGVTGLKGNWERIKSSKGQIVSVTDGDLRHTLLVNASTARSQMTSAEEARWFAAYEKQLDVFKPDVVFYYGGQILDFLIASEAKHRGIPVAFYLANGNYSKHRWHRDVDLILTDSKATADLYKERLGIQVKPIGVTIDPKKILGSNHQRKRLLFVNPSLSKGALIVAKLALILEQRRPDIEFEVIESRGSWHEILHIVTSAAGNPRSALKNVVVTPNTNDMRPVYSRARLLLAPSVWWESAGRVVVEAIFNGIPAIITDNGGLPEMAGDACIKIKLDKVFHTPPYTRIPDEQSLMPLVQRIENLYDNQEMYASMVAKAHKVGQTHHNLQENTRKLIEALRPLLNKKAGDL